MLWVGVVFASVFLGPVWKAISPVRTINLAFAKLSGSDPERGVYDYPERLGYWPAAIGLYAFVWIELVYPFPTELPSVRLWIAVYLAVMLVGGALFGNGFYERADPFEVFSIAGRQAVTVVGPRRPPDRPQPAREPRQRRGAARPDRGGRGAVRQHRLRLVPRVQPLGAVRAGIRRISENLLNNLALLAFCVGAGPHLHDRLRAHRRRAGDPARELPNRLAHSVVPIVVGYFVAHYLTYFFEVSQRTLQYASDPLSDGSNLLGTADLQINYWFSYHQTLVATIKVGAVVIGHVLGAMAAHDRAIKILPARHQLTGQLPLLFAMIAFTAGGLYLLFAPEGRRLPRRAHRPVARRRRCSPRG